MTDITQYKPSRDPNARDYPDKIDALIDALQGIVAELDAVRGASPNLAAATVRYAGLVANLTMAGFRATGAGNAVDPQDLVTYAQLVSATFSATVPIPGATPDGSHWIARGGIGYWDANAANKFYAQQNFGGF